MNNLQAEFEDNFYPHPHEDNDTKVCASNYAACNTCGKKYYYMNGSSCGHKKGSTPGLCDCGVQEEFDAQFAWFQSKLDAAVKEAYEKGVSDMWKIIAEEVGESETGFNQGIGKVDLDVIHKRREELELKFLTKSND